MNNDEQTNKPHLRSRITSELLSYAIALLRQSSLNPSPKPFILFLLRSLVSFQILTSCYSSESLAFLIAFSHERLPIGVIEAIKNNRKTNHTTYGSRTRKWTVLSKNDRVERSPSKCGCWCARVSQS